MLNLQVWPGGVAKMMHYCEKVKNQFIFKKILVNNENELSITFKHCKEEIMRAKNYKASRDDDHLLRKCDKVPLHIRKVLPSFSVS